MFSSPLCLLPFSNDEYTKMKPELRLTSEGFLALYILLCGSLSLCYAALACTSPTMYKNSGSESPRVFRRAHFASLSTECDLLLSPPLPRSAPFATIHFVPRSNSNGVAWRFNIIHYAACKPDPEHNARPQQRRDVPTTEMEGKTYTETRKKTV